MSAFNLSGLRPDQGPPLSVPLSFFFAATIAIAAAGALLVFNGGAGLSTVWSGFAVAIVHVATVGLLLLTMIGALYQMLPVVAGAVVPLPRLAHLTLALMVTGTVALVWAQATFLPAAFLAAAALLTVGLATFWFPAAYALLKAGATARVGNGLRLAMLGLFAVALVGLHLSWARGAGGLPNAWVSWRFAHAHLGLIGWVGALISVVSWQVVPMFYLARELAPWAQRTTLAGIGLTLAGLLAVYAFGLPQWTIGIASAPGALAVWLLNPALIARSIRQRKRRRKDPTLWFWWLSLGAAPLCLGLAAATALLSPPWIPVTYGVVVLWGWAGALVHGMLTRIVPFLLWFHRCSPLLGVIALVPSMKDLYPDKSVVRGFVLHAAALALGLAAAVSGADLLWRLFGVATCATGLVLGGQLAQAVRRAPRPQAAGRTEISDS